MRMIISAILLLNVALTCYINAAIIKFTYKSENAKRVSVVGDFNNWDNKKNIFQKVESDKFKTSVSIKPGVYRYMFDIDGKLVNDPWAKNILNESNRQYSLLFVSSTEIYSKKEDIPPFRYISCCGTFNKWDTTDPNSYMMYENKGIYYLKQLLKKGNIKFNFYIEGMKSNKYGIEDDKLIKNGSAINYEVLRMGYYKITVDYLNYEYSIKETAANNAVANILSSDIGYIGRDMVLSAESSIKRKGKNVISYFWQQNKENPEIFNKIPGKDKVILNFKKTGNYEFKLKINDGKQGISDVKNITIMDSFQLDPNFNIGENGYMDYIDNYYRIGFISSSNFKGRFRFKKNGNSIYGIKKNTNKIVENGDFIEMIFLPGKSYIIKLFKDKMDYIVKEKYLHKFTFRQGDYPEIKYDILSVKVNIKNIEDNILDLTYDLNGIFSTCVELSEGSYKYNFLINNKEIIPDKMNNGCIDLFEKGKNYDPSPENGFNIHAIKHDPGEPYFFSRIDDKIVIIRIRILSSDIDKIYVYVNGRKKKMVFESSKNGFDYYTVKLKTDTRRELSYYFKLYDNDEFIYIGDGCKNNMLPDENQFRIGSDKK